LKRRCRYELLWSFNEVKMSKKYKKRVKSRTLITEKRKSRKPFSYPCL